MEVHVKLNEKFRLQIAQCLECDNVLSEDERRLLRKMLKLDICDLRSLALVRKGVRGHFHMHEQLMDCEILLPQPEVPRRNPELEARVQRLKRELAERQYRDMTRDIDCKTETDPFALRSLGQELKTIDRQLISIFNMVFTVVGVFVFFYHCSKYLFNSENTFVGRLLFGTVAASIVFVADMYFLIKSIRMYFRRFCSYLRQNF
ncbi:unnamed protein product [Soboliphyme baturini]|uniref:Transmembrane protein 199 n=1 Tax=Soboliphyme baturini TaxID=241478 RepID=A0A183J9G1_9BILA|nr:unnamed protein product [Soboliphyme baturini]